MNINLKSPWIIPIVMTVAIVSGVGYFYLTNLYYTRYTKGYEEGFTAGEISGKDAYINARSQMAVANLSRTAVLRLASLYMSDNYTEISWPPCWSEFRFETTFVAIGEYPFWGVKIPPHDGVAGCTNAKQITLSVNAEPQAVSQLSP